MMLTEFPGQIIVADHHLGDVFSNSWTNSRDGFYGVTGTPTVWFDGVYEEVGSTSNCSSDAARYRSRINQRLNATGGEAPVSIRGDMAINGTTLTISATFEKVDPVALANTRAFLMVTENDILYNGTYWQHVTRAVYEQAVTLTNVGDEVLVQHDFTIGSWNPDNLVWSAWLQNMTSKEIYQSTGTGLAVDFAVSFDATMDSAPEGNETIEFHGAVTNISETDDQLTFSLNNTWNWPAEFKVEGDGDFHTGPVTKPLAVGADLEVWVRVTTDASVRIGSGDLNIHSAVTDQTRPTTLRVFNGSPAILVVDTDGPRTDETVVLSALTSGGYLYDHWDAHNGHADAAPAEADLAPYDMLLFHQGWNNDGLTAEAQATITSFMDSGRGVIVSGQDYLNGMTAGAFTSDYLGVGSFVVNQDADNGYGTGGDPIGDGMSFALTYPQWNLDRADNLTASSTGTIFMTSEESDRIAVRNDNAAARSVFCAFALNAMPAGGDPNNIKTLLGRSIEWIRQSSGESVDEPIVAGLASGVRGVGPNPFMPLGNGMAGTTIRLRISDAAANQPARLDVVDLNGRLVRNLLDAPLTTGLHLQTWDGRDAAGQPVGAGLYYIRFSNAEGSNGARLVVLH